MSPNASGTGKTTYAPEVPAYDEPDTRPGAPRKGPPNRMNDLEYSDWMKFQKSFFRHSTWSELTQEFVHFFTKAVWSSGRPSQSLIAGLDMPEAATWESRQVEAVEAASVREIVGALEARVASGKQYDFVLLNLMDLVDSSGALDVFVDNWAEKLFDLLRRAVIRHRYCGVLVSTPSRQSLGFPVPWSVALSARGSMRLRDEKIGLIEDSKQLFYCLFFQSADDRRAPVFRKSGDLRVAGDGPSIEPWLIPKPPPRKKGEMLHPAKFPETLVEHFIDWFSEPGQNVFDPMVGTGSTVVAALRAGRNGYGVDLQRKYVRSARKRASAATQLDLFDPQPSEFVIAQGDAGRLAEIEDLEGIPFHYCVTSPPYWSMLRNPGSENQRQRRNRDLPLVYSQSQNDLGNISAYDDFLDVLTGIYDRLSERLEPRSYLTVVVKNIKRKHVVYPLAWDLAFRLCRPDGAYDYAGTTLWCQDDVGLKPFAVGTHWVSNTLHHYCLHFQKREAED